MLSSTLFISKVKKIQSYKSITGKATYINCYVAGDSFHFVRQNTGKAWKLNLSEAYNAYLNETFINTPILRNYMSGRVYSPTLGLLIAIKLYNNKGVRN